MAKKDTPKKEKATKVDARQINMAARIKLMPLVTEKSVKGQFVNQVVFRVIRSASKGQIAQAIAEVYQVKPVRITTAVMKPKERRRGMSVGYTSKWKKAYVKVADVAALNILP